VGGRALPAAAAGVSLGCPPAGTGSHPCSRGAVCRRGRRGRRRACGGTHRWNQIADRAGRPAADRRDHSGTGRANGEEHRSTAAANRAIERGGNESLRSEPRWRLHASRFQGDSRRPLRNKRPQRPRPRRRVSLPLSPSGRPLPPGLRFPIDLGVYGYTTCLPSLGCSVAGSNLADRSLVVMEDGELAMKERTNNGHCQGESVPYRGPEGAGSQHPAARTCVQAVSPSILSWDDGDCE
jgi:hypothetical protein